MIPDHLIISLHKFGGYVFKPVSPKVLIDNQVIKDCKSFKGIAPDDDAPLYIVGFAANRVFKKNETSETLKDRLQPIDDYEIGFPYDSIMPMSFIAIYGDGGFTDKTNRGRQIFEAMYLKEDTTRLLEALMKIAGVQIVFDKYMSEHFMMERIGQFSMSECFPKKPQAHEETPAETPVEKPVRKQAKRISLSRKEILELLQTERECVSRANTCNRDCAKCSLVRDTDKLLAMYDAVIKTYQWHLKQNNANKLVRMADGSRKWVSNAEAVELLKLPRNMRT